MYCGGGGASKFAAVAALLVCGLAYGQQAGQPNEDQTGFFALIVLQNTLSEQIEQQRLSDPLQAAGLERRGP